MALRAAYSDLGISPAACGREGTPAVSVDREPPSPIALVLHDKSVESHVASIFTRLVLFPRT